MAHLHVFGAGWAGLAAAVAAVRAGHRVTLVEATDRPGGRARTLPHAVEGLALDNGQHIWIGAYARCLALLETVGLHADALFERIPLDLRDPQGLGLVLAPGPEPLNLLLGLWRSRGLDAASRRALLRVGLKLRWHGPHWPHAQDESVAQWCVREQLPASLIRSWVEPLCLSALNTPLAQASARVWWRVLHDALWLVRGGSDLCLPRADLNALGPDAAIAWLRARGVEWRLRTRLPSLAASASGFPAPSAQTPWVLALPPREAARLTAPHHPTWSGLASALEYEAIATVYVRCHDPGYRGLPRSMMALHSHAQSPAQFVFCRERLLGQTGVLAAVVSACQTERDALSEGVLRQLRDQLGLRQLTVLSCVVERRATFACSVGLRRPPAAIAPHLWAAGDYVEGPYPATLEGAVRSAEQVIAELA